jgi:hypothetical protein
MRKGSSSLVSCRASLVVVTSGSRWWLTLMIGVHVSSWRWCLLGHSPRHSRSCGGYHAGRAARLAAPGQAVVVGVGGLDGRDRNGGRPLLRRRRVRTRRQQAPAGESLAGSSWCWSPLALRRGLSSSVTGGVGGGGVDGDEGRWRPEALVISRSSVRWACGRQRREQRRRRRRRDAAMTTERRSREREEQRPPHHRLHRYLWSRVHTAEGSSLA